MQLWFDTLVKRIAQSTPSRREAIAALSLGAAGVDAGSPAWAQPASGCTRRDLDGSTVHEQSFSANGLSLYQKITVDRRGGGSSATIRVTRGATLVLNVDAQVATNRAMSAKVDYGAGVAGITHANVSSPDGKTLSGDLDGSRFTATAGIRSMSQLRLMDAESAPTFRSDPALADDVRGLLRAAKRDLVACRAVPTPPPRPPVFRRPAAAPSPAAGSAAATSRIRRAGASVAQTPALRGATPTVPTATHTMSYSRETSPEGNWYSPNSHVAPDCDTCLGEDCNNKYEDCLTDNALDYFCPPCAVEAIATCLVGYFACQGACYVAGGGCCPVLCGTPIIDNCCGAGATCMQDMHVCCPPGRVICAGHCCDLDVRECGPDGLCGCTGDGVPCGDQCCERGERCCGQQCCGGDKECCGGVCCTPGYCHNGQCCDPPQHRCGDQCCAPFNTCCNGACCAGACISGQCCPQAQACGPFCCAPGQFCTDARAGTCVTGNCGGGFGKMRGMVPCQTGVNGQSVVICCPAGVTCCAGHCCAPGMQCCAVGDGTTQCMSSCVH